MRPFAEKRGDPPRSLKRIRRWALASLALLLLLLAVPRAARAAAEVVLEIDAAAETMLDARATRRLVSLELADIDVLPGASGQRPALFFRVLGLPEGQVRVELWERGELSDVRVVSTGPGGHLLARRVALAAAELARRLRQQRLALRRQRLRMLEQLRVLAVLERARTLEGPVALRSEISAFRGRDTVLAGPSLTLELSIRRAFRLDLGLRLQGGQDDGGRARLLREELFLGPGLRLRLGSRADLDLGALVAAGAMHVGGAASVNEITRQSETWTARTAIAARFEPRLSRTLRGSLGLEGGLELRQVSATFAGSVSERFGGPYGGVSLGLILTPR
jgi:hypothetical protein